MAKKIEIPYKYIVEYDKVFKQDNHRIRFIMPNGEDVIIDIDGGQDYYPEDKNMYRYPNNVDDGVLFDLGEETYDYKGIICVYDEDKIRTRRALVRAYHDEDYLMKEGVVEISETYLKESK